MTKSTSAWVLDLGLWAPKLGSGTVGGGGGGRVRLRLRVKG